MIENFTPLFHLSSTFILYTKRGTFFDFIYNWVKLRLSNKIFVGGILLFFFIASYGQILPIPFRYLYEK